MGNTAGETFERLSAYTVWRVLEESAQRVPDKVAVVDGDRRLTYAEVRAESEKLAGALASLGFGKASIAAVYLPNSIEQVLVFYALQKLGTAIAWVNPNYRESELRFILENSGAQSLFLFQEWGGFDGLSAAVGLDGLPDLKHIVVAKPGDGFASADARVTTLSNVIESGAAPESPGGGGAVRGETSGQAVSPDDLSMLIYTSGTTAQPKGAMIRQSQVVRAGFAYSLGVDATEDDVFIGFLPMSHSYGCGALLVQPFILGATLVLLDRFSPEAALALTEQEKVTIQYAAPAHYIMELGCSTRGNYDISSLRAGMTAGQLAPAGLITRVEQEMGIYISSFLGSSEVGPGLSIILPYGTSLEVRERAIGYAIHGTEAKIVSPTTGEEMPHGEPGELVLSGWHVTEGYWRNPEETQNQIRDGWLHTGDLASRDEEGCFSILGRLKDCVNRGGFKVIPSEIESLLMEYPGIAEVCVVGTPNPVLGESVCACVVAAEDAGDVTLQKIREHLQGRLAAFKLPDELLVMPELPRMPGGVKVNRYSAGGVVELATASTEKQTITRAAKATKED
ncbi:MAG: AMP-binding protein [Actinobacteria bacterium]|nr:AMP-binding protein [Actinomycetota bacterium]